MPLDPVIVERALIVMAVCAALQVLMMGGVLIGLFVAWQRARRLADEQLAALHARLDDVSQKVQTAVTAVDRVAGGTNALVHDAGDVVRSVASAMAAPRTVLLAGAARMAGRALARWRGTRAARSSHWEERHVSSSR